MTKTETNVEREASGYGIGRTPSTPDTMGGRWRVACNCGTELIWNDPKDMNPPSMVAKLRQRGWLMSNRRSPTCPKCARENRNMKQQAIGPDPKIARKIYAMLDDHFNEESRLYRSGWSDGKIAKEIDTSVEIVSRIRVDAYGELAEDPAVQAFRDELELMRMELVELQERFGREFAVHLNKLAELEKRMPSNLRKVG